MSPPALYPVLIGLEIHVQLETNSKLFCSCGTEFGLPPNTQTCPICAGFPGTLPVLNQQALHLAIQAGLALNCQIETQPKWDRKNYFYPDLPKGYQISQFDRPICHSGWVELTDTQGIPTGKQIRINRAHLEEDAGKSQHDESGQGGSSMIDLNRAGIPLLEIVTHPDLTSPEETRDFLQELKLILTTLGVSQCNMQKGELRCDANVNLLVDASFSRYTPIVEIKNLNSFRAVERAIHYEIERQAEQYRRSGLSKQDAPKQTRGWDDQRQQTTLQRDKEESEDYRYFPEPDLPSVTVRSAMIAEIRQQLGRLPSQMREQLRQQALTPYDADLIVRQGKNLFDFFQRVVRLTHDAKLTSNWIQQEVLRYLNEHHCTIDDYPVDVESFAELLSSLRAKRLDHNRGKAILACMVDQRIDFQTAGLRLGVTEVPASDMRALAEQILLEYPHVVAEVKAGNTKAIGALIGKARQSNPHANPSEIRRYLLEMMSSN